MTRDQIKEICAESARRVDACDVGVTPRSEKHVERLKQLKVAAAEKVAADAKRL